MPIYEFHCQDCGKDNEILTRSTDWSGQRCPDCGSVKLEKKLSVFAAGSSKGSSRDLPAPPSCTGNPGNCGMCGLG
jgi:putative FmdB family regulatory protein